MKNAADSTRVVLDSNILISAIVFGGVPRKVLDMLAEDSITVVMSEEILTETKRIISARFPEFLADLAKVEKLLEVDAKWVRLGSISVQFSRDLDDDKTIETAEIGRCQFIVSGDKDLLVIKAYKEIKILIPAEFIKFAK